MILKAYYYLNMSLKTGVFAYFHGTMWHIIGLFTCKTFMEPLTKCQTFNTKSLFTVCFQSAVALVNLGVRKSTTLVWHFITTLDICQLLQVMMWPFRMQFISRAIYFLVQVPRNIWWLVELPKWSDYGCQSGLPWLMLETLGIGWE